MSANFYESDGVTLANQNGHDKWLFALRELNALLLLQSIDGSATSAAATGSPFVRLSKAAAANASRSECWLAVDRNELVEISTSVIATRPTVLPERRTPEAIADAGFRPDGVVERHRAAFPSTCLLSGRLQEQQRILGERRAELPRSAARVRRRRHRDRIASR